MCFRSSLVCMPGTANHWDVALNMASLVLRVFKAIHSSEVTHSKWKETNTMIVMDWFSFLRKLGLYIRKVLTFFSSQLSSGHLKPTAIYPQNIFHIHPSSTVPLPPPTNLQYSSPTVFRLSFLDHTILCLLKCAETLDFSVDKTQTAAEVGSHVEGEIRSSNLSWLGTRVH